jgi:hypothetical protein
MPSREWEATYGGWLVVLVVGLLAVLTVSFLLWRFAP